ncbi:hypothetical protein ASJ81_04415 [Methanosarcina spelaei]|uniref:Phage tail protein n=1 Tax=Methanosarcina spelaei TaxID=1036679 RepID=A0A2A2HUH7_9EURY|nr:phage tail protein [Methanosarcina spelaei]PAV12975.1 hypothetical protein ASJ81_04415 [Methanosarcina spelaei]
MTNVSSYVDYLPSVLWTQENDSSSFLGRVLCIFEKILSGVSDDLSIGNGPNEHNNFEKTIDELNQIFDPWKTNKNFLPWLASWVALTLPEDFSEYQKRKIISDIVPIYQERGLKKGLQAYLDAYATDSKPRIAIDDGAAVFRATFLENGTAVLHTVAYSNAISLQSETNTHEDNSNEDKLVTTLLHPSAIAVDNENNYIVVDKGDSSLSMKQPASLWKLSSTGDLEWKVDPSSSIPMPKPIYVSDCLKNPTAVVVDGQDNYYVVDIGEIDLPSSVKSAIYRFNPSIEVVINQSSNPTFPAVHPVDMILDSSGKFVVLDRGVHPQGEYPRSPEVNSGQKIIVVNKGPPMAVSEHPLRGVIEPTALAIDSEGCYIVADAKDQYGSDPADLIRVGVDPNGNWSETSILKNVKAENNPLIFPVCLVFENSQSLLVCDTGVRWGYKVQEDNRKMAEPAAIYRIENISQNSPTITRVTYERKFVNPTKMVIDRRGNLIITDKGEYLPSVGKLPSRIWRKEPNEFGVVVLFSAQRYTSLEDQLRIRREIANIVNEQKPGNTSWWMNRKSK